MGVVVTVMNMKGGVGKTTVAMHLAGVLARYNLGQEDPLSVLAIDYDPQFNLSQAFLPAKRYFELEKDQKTTLSILVDDDADLDPYRLQVPGNHNPPAVADLATAIYKPGISAGLLDIIPSTLDLMYVALGQANADVKPIEERFAKFIAECRAKYDVTIIDCHPAGSLFTKTSLNNSDHVLIPVMPQRYAVRGIGLMLDFISAKKKGTAGPQPHILFNGTARHGGTSEEEDAIRADKKYGPLCMKNNLKWYKAYSEPHEGKGFVWFSGAPYSVEARRVLRLMGQEFRTRIGL